MDGVAQAGAEAVAEARDVILALAPGFLALKVFQLLGTQRKRSEWEWTAWSVLAAALISVLPLHYWAQLGVGLGLGLMLAVLYRNLHKLPRIGLWAVQNLENSAWDHVLDRAVRERRVVEVALGEGENEDRFFGRVGFFAYEAYEAEPWLYLVNPHRKPPGKDYAALQRTRGVLIHKENIRWLRVLDKKLPSASKA